MAGLIRRPGTDTRVSVPDDGTTSNTNIRYPPPVTEPLSHYAGANPLWSAVGREYEYSDPKNAAIVSRHDRRPDAEINYIHGGERVQMPFKPPSVQSSEFQPTLVGAIRNWFVNKGWYIAFPAATISFGTMRNMGYAEKAPQLDTRITGGPGTKGMVMGPRPLFNRVQSVPRYSTAPDTYNTKGAPS